MIAPRVHLNGTSKASLLSGYTEAYNAVCDAMRKLSEAAPNARDYYPIGPDAFGQAVKEHTARMERLASVKQELLELCAAVEP